MRKQNQKTQNQKTQRIQKKQTEHSVSTLNEYEQIVEFSFNPKTNMFVVRFLDGSSRAMPVTDLPKKLQTRKPKWNDAMLSPDRASLLVSAGNEIREIPAYILMRGKPI